MISWTKLLTGQSQDSDNLRYSEHIDYAPKVVVWNATSRCNLRCQHCYFKASDKASPGELNKQEGMSFIEDLAEFDVPVLLFSGGEPLLREDIFELGRFAANHGIWTVLSTNGTLITEEVAKKIKESGFRYVGISLDGMEGTNDWFRQQKGAFAQALSGIRSCRKAGLKVGLRFTLTKCNFRELPDIFNLVEKEHVPRLCLYHLVCVGRGTNIKEKDLSHEEKREVLELVWKRTMNFSRKGLNIEILTVDNHADGVWIYLRLKRSDPERAQTVLKLLEAQGGNSSGIKIGATDDCGDIYADQFWRTHLLGNIRQRRFSQVWQDEANVFLRNLRDRRSLLKGRCQRCNFLSICNGNFRARAEEVSGDIWAEDPGCYLSEEEITK